MFYQVKFTTNIREHHVYKDIGTPVKGEKLDCHKNDRNEIRDYDKHAIGVYKTDLQGQNKLVGHIQIKLSSLLDYFLT